MDNFNQAFERLKSQDRIPSKFCFFIDGLDEYHGDHPELLWLLENLEAHPDIKICVSSRPWNVFREFLCQTSKRNLVLEKMTQADIEVHIEQEIKSSPNFQRLKAQDEQYKEISNEIATRAQGVFFWVGLVFRSLHRGFLNADSAELLKERVAELPSKLEDHFQHMFDQIESIYRRRTAMVLLTALQAIILPLMALLFEGEDNIESKLDLAVRPMSAYSILECQDDLLRRLDGWSRGLLERTGPIPFSPLASSLFFAYSA